MSTPSPYQCQDDDKFNIERSIANEIMDTVHRLQLPFKLDQITEGLGNCFPMAIIQQLQRPEISSQLRPAPKRLVRHKTGHTLLRQSVHQFIMKSRSPRVATFKAQYEETDGPANGETWCQYWVRMTTDRAWVDYWFVQATAWYLQLDIWIIATSSTESNPYIEVSGNLADGDKPSGGPILTLGTKSNSHYQSLLPIEMFHLEFQENQQNSDNSVPEAEVVRPSINKQEVQGKNNTKEHEPAWSVKTAQEMELLSPSNENTLPEKNDIISLMPEPFVYENNGNVMVFLCISENHNMKCPRCKMETRYIVNHLTKNTECQKLINIDDFKEQFRLYKGNHYKDRMKEDQRKRKAASREKLKKDDYEKVKQDQTYHKKVSRANLRAQDNEKVKQNQTYHKRISRATLRAQDQEKVKKEQTHHKKISRAILELRTMKKSRRDKFTTRK